MDNEQRLKPLLNDLIRDNPTYPFPLSTIHKELTNLLVRQEEYDYFMWMAYKKIKKDHSELVAKIYLTTAEFVINLPTEQIYDLPYTEYVILIERFYTTLQNLRITRIDKSSPDGELLQALL